MKAAIDHKLIGSLWIPHLGYQTFLGALLLANKRREGMDDYIGDYEPYLEVAIFAYISLVITQFPGPSQLQGEGDWEM